MLIFSVNFAIFCFCMQDDDDDDWFPEDIFEAFKELRKRRVFDVSDMYTIADAWGWTWEKELKNKCPRRWSQEWEVDLAIKVMQKASNYPVVAYLCENLNDRRDVGFCNAGYRTGRNTNYWRLCRDHACCHKSTFAFNFLDDIADNSWSWLQIWEVILLSV